MKPAELRDMSEEQLGLTLKETMEVLFRLRIQASSERLDAPSELRRNRRLIAQIKTIQRERELVAEKKAKAAKAQPAKPSSAEAASPKKPLAKATK